MTLKNDKHTLWKHISAVKVIRQLKFLKIERIQAAPFQITAIQRTVPNRFLTVENRLFSSMKIPMTTFLIIFE